MVSLRAKVETELWANILGKETNDLDQLAQKEKTEYEHAHALDNSKDSQKLGIMFGAKLIAVAVLCESKHVETRKLIPPGCWRE